MKQGREPKADWIALLLAASFLSLFFQLFPSVWWAIASVLDVRGWTWRAYTAIFGAAFVALVTIRAWQKSRDG